MLSCICKVCPRVSSLDLVLTADMRSYPARSKRKSGFSPSIPTPENRDSAAASRDESRPDPVQKGRSMPLLWQRKRDSKEVGPFEDQSRALPVDQEQRFEGAGAKEVFDRCRRKSKSRGGSREDATGLEPVEGVGIIQEDFCRGEL